MVRKTLALGMVLLLTALGCAGWRHGSTAAEYQGQVLRVRDGGPGARRLEVESGYDPTVRHFVEQNGAPDYIYMADRFSLQLMYIDDDRIVLFQRAQLLQPKSAATVTDGIPDGLVSLFTRADQDRLGQRRAHRGTPLPTRNP